MKILNSNIHPAAVIYEKIILVKCSHWNIKKG